MNNTQELLSALIEIGAEAFRLDGAGEPTEEQMSALLVRLAGVADMTDSYRRAKHGFNFVSLRIFMEPDTQVIEVWPVPRLVCEALDREYVGRKPFTAFTSHIDASVVAENGEPCERPGYLCINARNDKAAGLEFLNRLIGELCPFVEAGGEIMGADQV